MLSYGSRLLNNTNGAGTENFWHNFCYLCKSINENHHKKRKETEA